MRGRSAAAALGSAIRIDLGHGAFIDHDAAWLAEAEAQRLAAELVAALAWESRDIVLFGRSIPQPRLIAWAGELPYRYSGQTLEPRAWSPTWVSISTMRW